MVSIETEIAGDLFWTSFQKNVSWIDSEKDNRVFAGGGGGGVFVHAWFLEHKKAWLGQG